jgi:hypothetical protein
MQLGLSEKQSPNKKLQFPFDLVVSETSESNNTNGTNILSDDIDDLYFDDEPATGNFVPRRVEVFCWKLPVECLKCLTSNWLGHAIYVFVKPPLLLCQPEGNPQLELSLRISLDMAPPEASSSKEGKKLLE